MLKLTPPTVAVNGRDSLKSTPGFAQLGATPSLRRFMLCHVYRYMRYHDFQSYMLIYTFCLHIYIYIIVYIYIYCSDLRRLVYDAKKL